jgi:hypothetical protein
MVDKGASEADTEPPPGPEEDVRVKEIDADRPPNLDCVETEWSDTIREREELEADTKEAFRTHAGGSTPSSVVRSAEGHVLFPGLHVNNNGALSEHAREALKKGFRQEPPQQSSSESRSE